MWGWLKLPLPATACAEGFGWPVPLPPDTQLNGRPSPREGLCRADAEMAARNPKSGHADDPISTPTPRTGTVRLSRQRVRVRVRRLVRKALGTLTLTLSRREGHPLS